MTSNVNFDGLSFVDNLNNIPSTNPPNILGVPNLSTGLEAMINADRLINGPNSTKTAQFFASFNKTNNPIPTDINQFMEEFANFIGAPSTTTNPYNNLPWIRDFLEDFSTARHDNFSLDTRNFSNDPWQSYFNNETVTTSSESDLPLSTLPTATETINQFKAWFKDFATNFPYNADGTITKNSDDYSYNPNAGQYPSNNFVQQMSLNLATTVSISSNKQLWVLGKPVRYQLLSTLPSYQDVYNALFPSGGAAGFQARFTEFYNEQVNANGYFLPSQAFAQWTAELKSEFTKTLGQVGDITFNETQLSSSNFKKTLVLNKIFLLIASLLNTLQRVAAVQAQRLTIFTDWQKAYTNSLAQLPVFLSSQNPANRLVVTGANDSEKSAKDDARSSINSTLNLKFRDTLQTNRNLVSDDSKALQSNINQSSDAVSQQANMATAIIQELSTLLSAIYR